VSARWIFRAVAGDTPGRARRTLAATVVSVLVVAVTIAAPAAVLVSLSAIASVFDGIAVPEAAPDHPTVAWGLVALTSVSVVGAAVVVSWTSGRRARRGLPGPSSVVPGNHEGARRAGADDRRATRPPTP
jgi:hypothetical protein